MCVCVRLLKVETIVGVHATNLAINVIIVTTKEVIYRKSQRNRKPNGLQVNRNLYYQIFREKILTSSRVNESNLWSKWGSIERDLMRMNQC